MIPARALVAGLRAAVEAPFWTRPRRFPHLIDAEVGHAGVGPSSRESVGADRAAAGIDVAVNVSGGALRRLARLHGIGGPWRNACLHRAIAACLVLRRHGVPARLRVGARQEGSVVTAHAWVEDPTGRALWGSALDHTVLTRSEPAIS